MEKEYIFQWYNQWVQLFGKWNFRTFTLIQIELEDDRCLGGIKFIFVLLGIGFCFRVNYTETETTKEIQERMKELDKLVE